MHPIAQEAEDLEVDPQWAISRRMEFLNQKIVELKNKQQSALQLLSGNNELGRFLLLDTLKLLSEEIKKYEIEVNFKNTGKGSQITQTDIERARSYPLENLLQNIRNNKTHCISGTHEDRRPSMDTRNGFAYCYSCGWQGDAIAVFMKLNSVDFVTAVKALNNF